MVRNGCRWGDMVLRVIVKTAIIESSHSLRREVTNPKRQAAGGGVRQGVRHSDCYESSAQRRSLRSVHRAANEKLLSQRIQKLHAHAM